MIDRNPPQSVITLQRSAEDVLSMMRELDEMIVPARRLYIGDIVVRIADRKAARITGIERNVLEHSPVSGIPIPSNKIRLHYSDGHCRDVMPENNGHYRVVSAEIPRNPMI